MKKALFFRIGAIGDTLLTTPAVRYFKINNPDFEVHYMAGYPAVEILKNNPYIDKVLFFDEVKTGYSRFINAMLAGKNIKNTIDRHYDVFFDFESSYYSAYLSFHVNAKEKAGFKITQKRKFYLNHLYNYRLNYGQKNIYMPLRFIELIKKYAGNKNNFNIDPVLVISTDEKNQAEKTLRETGINPGEKAIAVCISGTWESKKWPLDNWIKLFEKLSPRKIILLWGPGDEEDVKRIKEKNLTNVFVIPDVKIRDLSAIVSFSEVLVSNDNGVRHIAQALSVKTIGLFGPTDEKGWMKQDENNVALTTPAVCRPCDKTRCKNNFCMKDISPDAVIDKIKKFMFFS
ncbi:MAG TPA: glycosyltransferase family 9 protein [Candidatus Goldiibacteriota bacterium]|nr:glycosyltransferase family 9 protein [Candidatus Goldiibacteriota bacterium]